MLTLRLHFSERRIDAPLNPSRTREAPLALPPWVASAPPRAWIVRRRATGPGCRRPSRLSRCQAAAMPRTMRRSGSIPTRRSAASYLRRTSDQEFSSTTWPEDSGNTFPGAISTTSTCVPVRGGATTSRSRSRADANPRTRGVELDHASGSLRLVGRNEQSGGSGWRPVDDRKAPQASNESALDAARGTPAGPVTNIQTAPVGGGGSGP